MIKNLLLLAGLLTGINTLGITPDSSLFTTEFERNIFRQIENADPIDTIDLFLALDYMPSTAKEKVQSFIKKLKSQVDHYPVGKKLKTAFKSIHDEFLTKYTEEAFFKDIFINGNYNCVSASALYALILKELDVKYLIKETPVHVYLIADPGRTDFLIETTLPGEKIIRYDERTKTNYIEYLHNNKIISDEEFRSSTVEELFEKHYSKDKTISLMKLAGLQYYNKGVFQFNRSDYNAAMVSFEKAVLLNRDEMIKYMRNTSMLNVLALEHQKKTYNGYTLAKYINTNDSNSQGIQYGIDYFNVVSGELIVNRPNMSAYNNYFQQLSSSLEVPDTADLYRIYHFFSGFYHCVNYRYGQGLSHLEIAYALNPENISTKELITQSLTKNFMNDRNHDSTIDSLEYYLNLFPYLKQDKNIVGYLEYCYAKSIETSFASEDLNRGSKRLNEYETFLRRYKDFEPNKDYLEMIYHQIGLYYLFIDRADKAEQILRKGIRMIPDAEALKALLKSIMSSRGGAYEYPELMNDNKPVKKYLMALAKAKDNIEFINENVDKYLLKEWKLSKLITAGIEKDASPDMNRTIRFLGDHKVEYNDNGTWRSGRWSFNNSKCILELSLDGEKKLLHIIVTEILPGRLKGVMYEQENYEASVEMIFTPVIEQAP